MINRFKQICMICVKIYNYILLGNHWFYHCLLLPSENSQGTPVSSTNKTNHHDVSEILLKVALSTTTLTLNIGFDLDILIFKGFAA